MTNQSLLRTLGFRETVALVIGTVIGTGVFLKTAIMANQVGSPLWVLVAFAAAGLLSLCGALCYAELGSLFPRAGGEYVFLREAYGDGPAFLYGWMRFWIGTPGSIAAYAVGAATFASGILPLGSPGARTAAAVAVIWILSLVNCLSVAFGGRFQTFLTFLKLLMILGLTGGILLLGQTGSWAHLSVTSGSAAWPAASAFGAAMIAALWAYDGWNNMPMAAGEIKNPERTIPRALGLGMFGIFLIYMLANLSYFYALPFDEILTSYSNLHPDSLPVATKAAQMLFGPIAVGVLSVAFVFSALGAMNGAVLTGARVPYAMAKDGLFFERLGRVSESQRVPAYSVLTQAVVATVLALSGSFDQLTDYVVFASWIFYALVAGSVLLLRRKRPDLARSYQVPFYPVLPFVFIVCSLLLLVNTLASQPVSSGIGVAFIASGIPVYLWFRRQKRQFHSGNPP